MEDSMNDFTFSDAELPWLPELGDVEYFKVNSDDPEYWKKFGWEQLEVPSDCPKVNESMTRLKVRFDNRYFSRMLNSETMERWQVRLQNRFDEVVHTYERAYILYETYHDQFIEDVLEGSVREVTDTGSSSSTGSGTDDRNMNGTVRNVDTPDEKVNDVSGYAGSRSSSDSIDKHTISNQASDDYTKKLTERSTITGSSLLVNVNNSIKGYQDVDTEFIKEFENLFLNILWY